MGKPDPLAGLETLTPRPDGAGFKLDRIFRDQPEQLERIRNAYRNGLSPNQIADHMTANGCKISDSAIDGWLKKENVARG